MPAFLKPHPAIVSIANFAHHLLRAPRAPLVYGTPPSRRQGLTLALQLVLPFGGSPLLQQGELGFSPAEKSLLEKGALAPGFSPRITRG
jgi:hypothetical protein